MLCNEFVKKKFQQALLHFEDTDESERMGQKLKSDCPLV